MDHPLGCGDVYWATPRGPDIGGADSGLHGPVVGVFLGGGIAGDVTQVVGRDRCPAALSGGAPRNGQCARSGRGRNRWLAPRAVADPPRAPSRGSTHRRTRPRRASNLTEPRPLWGAGGYWRLGPAAPAAIAGSAPGFGLPPGQKHRLATAVHTNIVITHHQVADPLVACTADYPVVETTVPLGSDFEPGVQYTVRVNSDTAKSFGGHSP